MVSQPLVRPGEAQQASFIVEMFREPDRYRRDHFSCTLSDWDFMHELGRTFGWLPFGTTYLPQRGQPARRMPIKHDYRPGDIQDRKRVEADDAERLITALERARQSQFIAGILQAHAQLQPPDQEVTEQSLQSMLQSFIEFARRGPFTIALRPES
jgi:hypothetical protein